MEKCNYCGKEFRLIFGKSCVYNALPFCSEKCREQYCSLSNLKRKERKFKLLCFGVFLALFIMPMLSFGVFSEDTSALKYPITQIPLGPSTTEFRKMTDSSTDQDFYTVGDFTRGFNVAVSSSTSLSSSFQYPRTYNFYGEYDSSSDVCFIPSVHNSYYYTDGVDVYSPTGSDVTFYSYRNYLQNNGAGIFNATFFSSSDSPFSNTSSYYSQLESSVYSVNLPSFGRSLCGLFNYAYTDNPLNGFPGWDWSSLVNIPLVNDRFKYADSEPFTYGYSTLELPTEGLKSSEIFNAVLPDFRSISISFDEFREVGKWLSPDDSDDSSTERVTKFSLGGSIVFDSDYILSSDSDFSTRLFITDYYNPDPRVSQYNKDYSLFENASVNSHDIYSLSDYMYSVNIDCSITEDHISQGDDTNIFSFVCDYDPSDYNDGRSTDINFRFMNLELVIGYSASLSSPDPTSSYISTNADWAFKDFYIITNGNFNDAGWSGSASQSGGSVSDAPGNDDESGDYFQQLVNLFNFNFTNPFAPLFQLFTDGNDCVDIPIIAGMLGSTETQYCSWFPASVKNILTPVLGLSSLMLVFGFAVRWLGSSSGNLFEDAGSHDAGRVHVTTKGKK